MILKEEDQPDVVQVGLLLAVSYSEQNVVIFKSSMRVVQMA